MLLLAQSERAPITLARLHRGQTALYSQPQACSDGRGGLYVVFRATLQGKAYGRLLAQHFNLHGEMLWNPEGKAITELEHPQEEPCLLPDGNGGLILAWLDKRDGHPQVYIQAFAPDGTTLWKKEGQRVAPTDQPQANPQLVTDYRGGCYLAWQQQEADSRHTDVYVQRINPNGRPLWGPGGLLLVKKNNSQQNPRLASTPGRGVHVLWEDFRSGERWQLYGQRISDDGRALWRYFGEDLSGTLTSSQVVPKIAADGFGGLLCVYELSGPGNSGKDLHILRLNQAGRLAYNRPLREGYGNQHSAVLFQKGGDLWAAWTDEQSGKPSVYLQKININDGQLAFGPSGMQLARSSGAQTQPKIALAALTGELLVSWLQQHEGSAQLCLQKFNLSGQAMWGEPQACEEVGAAGRLDYSLAGDERGGSWLLWRTPSIDDGRIMLQKWHNSGQAIDLVPWAAVRPTASSHPRLEHIAAASGKHNDAYVAWEDYRTGKDNADIYLQRVDEEGFPMWPVGGVPICRATGNQRLPRILPVKGGVYLVWIDERTGGKADLYMQFVGSDGQARWRQDGMLLCVADGSQVGVSLCAVGQDNMLVAWTDARAFQQYGFDVYAQRVDPLGKQYYMAGGVPVTEQAGYQTGVQLHSDGFGGAYLAWMDQRSGVYNIILQHLDAQGRFTWPKAGIVAAPSGKNQRQVNLQLTNQGNLYLLWSEDQTTTAQSRVYLQGFTPDGRRLMGTQGRTLSQTYGAQTQPRLSSSPMGLVATWLDQRNERRSGYNLYTSLLDDDARARWERFGTRLGRFLKPYNAFGVLVHARTASVYYAWNEHGTNLPIAYYARIGLETGELLWKQELGPAAAQQIEPTLFELAGHPAAVWVEIDEAQGEARLRLRRLE